MPVFKTSNLQLAIFLSAKDNQVRGIDAGDPMRKEFRFEMTAELESLVEIYRFGKHDEPELLVNVKALEQARTNLLDLLNGKL